MKLKKATYRFIKPVAHFYPMFVALAIAQAVFTFILPLIYPQLDAAYWLLSFSGCAFWLTSFVLLKQAHHARQSEKGFKARIRNSWENLMFSIWLITFLLLILWLVKIGLFLLQG